MPHADAAVSILIQPAGSLCLRRTIFTYVSLPDNQSIQSSMDTLMDFKPDEMQAMMSMMEDYLKNAGDNPDPEKAPPHIKVA